MILSDGEIKESLDSGDIVIDPLTDPLQIQPSSVDLKLDEEFRIFKHTEKAFIDPKNDSSLAKYTELIKVVDGKPFILHPGEFVLGSTKEYIKLPRNIVGRLEGRSSLGRLGVIIHSTAGYVDPGFHGKLTLEITNIGKMPVALYPGTRVCQISFYRMGRDALVSYDEKPDAKYLGQTSPEMSKVTKDREMN